MQIAALVTGGDLAHCHWCQHAGCANHLVQLQLDAGELPVVNYHVFLCTVFTGGARAVRVRAAGGKHQRSSPPLPSPTARISRAPGAHRQFPVLPLRCSDHGCSFTSSLLLLFVPPRPAPSLFLQTRECFFEAFLPTGVRATAYY